MISKMTKSQALKIQAEQVEYYSKFCPDIAERVAAMTTADQLEDDVPYDIVDINKHIPRGGTIEYLAGLADMGGD